MRKIKKAVCFLILCLLIIISSFGQAEEQEQKAKTKVKVYHTGEDTIGIRLAYEIKEKIRSSFEYEVTNKIEEADLSILMASASIKMGESEPMASAISVVFTYQPQIFHRVMNNVVVILPRDKDIASNAGDIVAMIDKDYQNQRADLESLYEALMTGLEVIYKDK